ncbi:hypothetical protein CYMTET_37438 [Cymbomonas tetramitiformis]|uniref:Uncharacterized protein n=1 Tax=Cymbomonas tetramitiformis TaxID=36881 RepID=A0AAE0F6M9_9CHLO|nr:hypothetical protein CYMTET_37438 [Cymbomonas tetramitiformis]
MNRLNQGSTDKARGAAHFKTEEGSDTVYKCAKIFFPKLIQLHKHYGLENGVSLPPIVRQLTAKHLQGDFFSSPYYTQDDYVFEDVLARWGGGANAEPQGGASAIPAEDEGEDVDTAGTPPRKKLRSQLAGANSQGNQAERLSLPRIRQPAGKVGRGLSSGGGDPQTSAKGPKRRRSSAGSGSMPASGRASTRGAAPASSAPTVAPPQPLVALSEVTEAAPSVRGITVEELSAVLARQEEASQKMLKQQEAHFTQQLKLYEERQQRALERQVADFMASPGEDAPSAPTAEAPPTLPPQQQSPQQQPQAVPQAVPMLQAVNS